MRRLALAVNQSLREVAFTPSSLAELFPEGDHRGAWADDKQENRLVKGRQYLLVQGRVPLTQGPPATDPWGPRIPVGNVSV